MMNPISILPFLAALILCASGCNKEKDTLKPSAENCHSGKIVKSVRNQKGIVQSNAAGDQYSISVHIPGTYDSVDVGFICEASAIPKQAGLKIYVSGNYYAYTGDEKTGYPAGVELYLLDVTSFKVRDE